MQKKIAPNDIHRRFLNVQGDQRVYVSTMWRWVARFSSGEQRRERQATFRRAMHSLSHHEMEERLDQLIRSNRRMTTRELYGAEYRLQCAGNGGVNLGISQSSMEINRRNYFLSGLLVFDIKILDNKQFRSSFIHIFTHGMKLNIQTL